MTQVNERRLRRWNADIRVDYVTLESYNHSQINVGYAKNLQERVSLTVNIHVAFSTSRGLDFT